MAIFNFTNPGQYGSAYFTLETVPNSQGFFDSSSFPNAQGYYSNFTNLNESYIVTSSYVFGVVVPPGSSSFEFNPSNSAMPTGSLYFRGTGGIGITVDTYSGSYVVSPSQGYNGSILDTFPLTPVPNFQARVAVSGGYYQDIESQNTILNSIGTDLLRSASLVITPNAYKEDALYSVIPTNGNGDFTVTRVTTATLTNANGNVVLEPYNLLSYSEQFDNVYWTKSLGTLTTNVINAPNGTLTADLFTKTSAVNTVSGITPTSAYNNTGVYTYSVYVKRNIGDSVLFRLDGAGNTCNSTFTFSTKTFVNSGANFISASFEELSDGWFRIALMGNVTSTSWSLSGCVLFSNPTNDSFYFWGAQLVEGTSALPYQPTLDRLDRVRLDYSIGGEPNILLEPQRTNLAVSSSFFDGAAWVKNNTTVTANTTTSPSGIVDADTLVGDGVNSGHYAAQSISFTSGTTYTFSIYAKKNTNDFIQLLGSDTRFGSSQFANFDLNNGVVGSVGSGTTATITSAGNGWYRCAITITATSTGTGLYLLWLASSSTSARAETNTLTTSVFLWGAQIEAGAYATSYIPTTTATVTRNADQMTRNNIYTNGLITAAGGTWFVDFRNNRVYTRDHTGRIGIGDSNALSNDAITITTGASAGRLTLQKRIATVLTTLYVTTTDACKVVIKWNGSTIDIFENGIKVVSAAAFTPTVMEFFGTNTSNPNVPYFINSMILYPTPLPDSKCIELTGGGFDTPELAYASIGVVSESPTYLNQSVNSLIF